jgi:hypothetical protein
MALMVILPVFGLSKGRLTVEQSDDQAASSMSARSARFSFSYGSPAPVKQAWRTKKLSPL